MAQHEFKLVAGDPALELLNTISDWTVAEPRDYLPDFPEAIRFGMVAGILTPAEAKRLSTLAPGGELRRLKELRERLARIFRAVIDAREPTAVDLAALGRDAADAARESELRTSGGRLTRIIPPHAASTLRLRIVEAAIALLTSSDAERVKGCASCAWFFLDTSKNGSRRWCSMSMCGSVVKARRYYWRTRRPARA
ncbi:MAG: CGNR zinc finger domain-containing protein [Gemmatimonadaceae bacterium]